MTSIMPGDEIKWDDIKTRLFYHSEIDLHPRFWLSDQPASAAVGQHVPPVPLVYYESAPGVYHKCVMFNKIERTPCQIPKDAVLRAPTNKTDLAWLREEVYDPYDSYIQPRSDTYGLRKHTTYVMFDNNFAVYVSNETRPTVTAYAIPYGLFRRIPWGHAHNIHFFTKLVYRAESVEAVWVGKHVSPYHSNRLYGSGVDITSLLVKLSELRYVHIGKSIFAFDAYAPLTNFVSPLASRSYPTPYPMAYPYAVDQQGRVYLLLEDAVLEHVPKDRSHDPYNYYRDTTRLPYSGHFLMGTEKIELSWSSDPSRHFRCWLDNPHVVGGPGCGPDFPTDTLYAVDRNGVKRVVPEALYTRVMQAFGLRHGLHPLKNKQTLVPEPGTLLSDSAR